MIESEIPEWSSQRQSVESVKQAYDQIIDLMKQNEKKFSETESFKNEMNPAKDMMRVFQNSANKESVYVKHT